MADLIAQQQASTLSDADLIAACSEPEREMFEQVIYVISLQGPAQASRIMNRLFALYCAAEEPQKAEWKARFNDAAKEFNLEARDLFYAACEKNLGEFQKYLQLSECLAKSDAPNAFALEEALGRVYGFLLASTKSDERARMEDLLGYLLTLVDQTLDLNKIAHGDLRLLILSGPSANPVTYSYAAIAAESVEH